MVAFFQYHGGRFGTYLHTGVFGRDSIQLYIHPNLASHVREYPKCSKHIYPFPLLNLPPASNPPAPEPLRPIHSNKPCPKRIHHPPSPMPMPVPTTHPMPRRLSHLPDTRAPRHANPHERTVIMRVIVSWKICVRELGNQARRGSQSAFSTSASQGSWPSVSCCG